MRKKTGNFVFLFIDLYTTRWNKYSSELFLNLMKSAVDFNGKFAQFFSDMYIPTSSFLITFLGK
jgi:hypothetical protein